MRAFFLCGNSSKAHLDVQRPSKKSLCCHSMFCLRTRYKPWEQKNFIFGQLLIVHTLGGIAGMTVVFKCKRTIEQDLEAHLLLFLSRSDHGMWVGYRLIHDLIFAKTTLRLVQHICTNILGRSRIVSVYIQHRKLPWYHMIKKWQVWLQYIKQIFRRVWESATNKSISGKL